MHFIYFTDEDGLEIGLPLKRIVSLEFSPTDPELDDDEDQLKVNMDDEEYYEILGKAARKAFDEIKIQIRKINELKAEAK